MFFSLIFVIILGNCNYIKTQNQTSKKTISSTNSVDYYISDKQYKEIINQQATGLGMLSDPSNVFTYEKLQMIAPNDNLISFSIMNDEFQNTSDNFENYCLNIYDLDNGKIATIYSADQDEKPTDCIGLVYYTNRINSTDLKNAKTLSDIYNIIKPDNKEEFLKYFDSIEYSPMFYNASNNTSAEKGLQSLHLTDDGFYVMNYNNDLLLNSYDKSSYNMECQIKSIEKCEQINQVELYQIICKYI